MVDLKKSLKDYGMQVLNALLTGKTPEKNARASLNDLTLDDLRREKVRLDQEERRYLGRVRELEKQKRIFFEEGVRSASEREQKVAARKIKELDVEASSMDRTLDAISKQNRIINGLLQVKERYRFTNESGVSSLLKDLDLQDLIVYIDKASVDGEFQSDKFEELIRALEESDAVVPGLKEDRDVQDIVTQMQKAREALDNPAAMEQQFSEMTERMKKSSQDKTLEAGEEEL
jgi:hypothetical protein